MHDNGGILHSIRKSHSPGATLLYGKNLKAKLKHINQDIIGHYDIIVIEEDGTLHVYNFAMNSTGAWKGEKYKKYKHRMALLK
jgi:hypothetical protein